MPKDDGITGLYNRQVKTRVIGKITSISFNLAVDAACNKKPDSMKLVTSFRPLYRNAINGRISHHLRRDYYVWFKPVILNECNALV
jgi:hypothetical protein